MQLQDRGLDSADRELAVVGELVAVGGPALGVYALGELRIFRRACALARALSLALAVTSLPFPSLPFRQ